MGDSQVLIRGRSASFLLLVILGACSTNPGRTTAIGAGTGAALGAGLGAIVGAGAGDSGTGITLGTVAGTAAGTFVGNAIEGQDNEIASQGEVIRAQDRALMSQRAELDRLRTRLGDDGAYSNSDTGPFPPADQSWGQNTNSTFGAPERSMSFKAHSHNPHGSGAETAGFGGSGEVRSHADFGAGASGGFNEDSSESGSSDGHVFISKNDRAANQKSGLQGLDASVGDQSSSVRFSEGDSKLSASHPANRYSKYRDPQSEKSGSLIVRSRAENAENKGFTGSSIGGVGDRVSSKGIGSRSEPKHPVEPFSSDLPSHPKRGRGAFEEKSASVPVVDNAQGEDEKVLAASSNPSQKKASETFSSDVGAERAGSSLERAGKSEESTSEGALTASRGKECQDAAKELARAGERALPADKLFHLRRALRLCPEDPQYHLELAGLYRSLGRDGDAIYEYHEATRVDPGNEEASKALRELGSSAS